MDDQAKAEQTKPEQVTPEQAQPEQATPEQANIEQAKIEQAKPDQLWYVIHAQTGQELKVKSNLDSQIEQGLLGEQISEVLVPTERVAEIRGGKKHISERKFFSRLSAGQDAVER